MKLHTDTFNYLRPSDTQLNVMQNARDAAREYAEYLERVLPDGADKTRHHAPAAHGRNVGKRVPDQERRRHAAVTCLSERSMMAIALVALFVALFLICFSY